MDELSIAISQFGLQALLEHMHAMALLVESNGKLISWNPAFNAVQLNFPEATTLQEFLPCDEKNDLTQRLEATCQIGQVHSWRFDLITDRSGSQLCCDCIFFPISDQRVLFIAERVATDPAILGAIEKLNRQVKLFRMESERAKKIAVKKQIEFDGVMAQMQELSNIDPLTFLPNRREILRQLNYEVTRAKRYNNLLSVSILDLDHFKMINDTYGHVTGDRVLREVAILLRDSIRQPDVVGRYGGEEFLLILPNTDLEAATLQSARLCKLIRNSSVKIDQRSIHVTLSIGVTQLQSTVDTWQTFLSRADTAMYEAKRRGRNQWVAAPE